MAGTRRVLVTGSTGNLGRKAVQALASTPNVEVWGLDRRGPDTPSGKDERFIAAELAVFDTGWARTFEGASCVLHLAADPKPVGTWESVVCLNIDLSLNVLRAAEEAGVDRVVFASSNWVLGGYRFTRDRLASTLPPRPVNPYGASKLFIERYGRSLADRSGMAFLALRIGYCQPGENMPGPHMAFGRWGQEMWLGNRDWAQAVIKAAAAPFSGFAAVNIVSRNVGMRWDLEEARAAIGYVPEQTHHPRLHGIDRIKDRTAQFRDRMIARTGGAPMIGERW